MTTFFGLPNVSTENSDEVPTTSTRFCLGIAFGLDLQVHRHAEGVEVLRDLAHHAEAPSLRVRKMVYSSLNSGAPLDSIHWMKK